MLTIAPTPTVPDRAVEALATRGHAVLDAAGTVRFAGTTTAALDAVRASWDALPPDRHLLDGGRYRKRRHASYIVRDGRAEPVPHRAHWQPVEYNALHGGIERWFEPIEPAVAASAGLVGLLAAMGRLADAVRGRRDAWFLEAHQFRIDTEGGIGRPTPEGAHRDGVDLVAVVLVDRHGVKGGETRVFDADGAAGVRFTLVERWSCLLLDDARVIHESTPIQPLEAGVRGHRDTLVLTVRGGGFQQPAATNRSA